MITIHNISEKNIDHLINTTSNKFMEDDKYWVFSEDVEIKLLTGDVITIPEGFRFNGSSVPRLLRNIMPIYGAVLFAAGIHDYLYHIGYLKEELGEYGGRLVCDEEMLYWSKVTNNKRWTHRLDNYIRYAGVRVGGKSEYDKKD